MLAPLYSHFSWVEPECNCQFTGCNTQQRGSKMRYKKKKKSNKNKSWRRAGTSAPGIPLPGQPSAPETKAILLQQEFCRRISPLLQRPGPTYSQGDYSQRRRLDLVSHPSWNKPSPSYFLSNHTSMDILRCFYTTYKNMIKQAAVI